MPLFIYLLLLCGFSSVIQAQDLSTSARQKSAQKYYRQKVSPSPVKTKPNADKTVQSWVFNVGSHTEFFGEVQSDASGGTRKFELAPTIGAGMLVPMSSMDLKFLPEFNWVLPRSAGSSRILKNVFMFRADLAYDAWDWLRFRLGTSLIWLNQHGRGGKANVNNGTSTSTFYYPDENRSSMNNTLDVGIEALLNEAWAVRLQTYTYSVFITERRQVSYTLFLSYYWDR